MGYDGHVKPMPSVTLPVTRPVGRAMLVASTTASGHAMKILLDLGYQCAEMEDPYKAMAELCRRPLAYQSLILSLISLYREELAVIHTVKRRFPHMEIWLTGTDGRTAALAEAMRLGADGLLADDGFHRTAVAAPAITALPPKMLHPVVEQPQPSLSPPPPPEPPASEDQESEPVLTADELRALLRG